MCPFLRQTGLCSDLSTNQQVLSQIFIFLFLDSCAKVKKELLPCLRSFTSGLRVAEVPLGFFHIRGLSSHIFRWCGTWGCWSSPTLQKPPLSRTSKILGLCWRLRMDRKGELDANKKCLYHSGTLRRFEDYLRGWMKGIGDLLNESEQLRVETDDSGPQVFLHFFNKLNLCYFWWKLTHLLHRLKISGRLNGPAVFLAALVNCKNSRSQEIFWSKTFQVFDLVLDNWSLLSMHLIRLLVLQWHFRTMPRLSRHFRTR